MCDRNLITIMLWAYNNLLLCIADYGWGGLVNIGRGLYIRSGKGEALWVAILLGCRSLDVHLQTPCMIPQQFDKQNNNVLVPLSGMSALQGAIILCLVFLNGLPLMNCHSLYCRRPQPSLLYTPLAIRECLGMASLLLGYPIFELFRGVVYCLT